ncbi:hypothetical protein C1631_016675 [Chryseobacterium phosphatilyticum]|uniref:Uncharacterized protein n=1 Tax=Chryseobacterium phosphatilyticum TaxID=475075 RepID=A0A316X7J7_9FLAO|nr:hypothetical protein [Chryseobacterium phosphatilyticum]PWN68333.1 hypothetical protein C1631_016675 [Chryseobacterium phosphatilyticum]
MNKLRLINSIIQKGNLKRYLEIGTNSVCGVYTKKHLQNPGVFVCDTDNGLGIVQKKYNLPINVELDTCFFRKFIPYTYQDLKNNPQELINLKPQDIVPSINRFHY